MKKIVLTVLFSLLAITAFTACSNSESSEPEESAEKNHQKSSGKQSITLTAGHQVIQGELNDSATSQAFLATLPQTISMNNYDDREYYGRIEALTEEGQEISDFSNGDITYYATGPSLAIFFDKEDESNQSGLIKMGEITSDLSLFSQLDDTTDIIITRD